MQIILSLLDISETMQSTRSVNIVIESLEVNCTKTDRDAI